MVKLENRIIVLIIAMGYFAITDYCWWIFILLLLVPNAFIISYASNNKLGATIYNIGHSYLAPLAIGLVAYTTSAEILLAISAIWVAHISIDRSMGYGLKLNTGF